MKTEKLQCGDETSASESTLVYCLFNSLIAVVA